MSKVIYSPSKYIQGKNEILYLKNYASVLGRKSAYAIVDSFVLDHYKEMIMSSFISRTFPLHLNRFAGECSMKEIELIRKDLKEKKSDVIIGIGGGKTIDTAKAVSYYAGLPVIIVPTIASTDSPCSALSVIYTEDGIFEKYLKLVNNPNTVLVDTNIISKSPIRLFVAGMGDALATYYEARACYRSGAKTISGGKCSISALALAERCLEVVLEDGLKSKYAIENQTLSTSVDNIIEANTYLSGIGFESGGLAAAHAIHNGLTSVKETHPYYHGEKVAFGTIVQLVMENASLEEINMIINFCKEVGLPTNLHQLGIKKISDDIILKIAENSCAKDETIFNMPFKVTVEDVKSALYIANKLGE